MIPEVSIIMAVHNSADTLLEAVDSIRAQTMPNWELVICDDASTDDTPRLLESIRKESPGQIHLLHNSVNSRLSYSLNRCLELARGTYIARMDGDDLSAPDRLMRQVDFLNHHPEFDLVGCTMRRFDSHGFYDVVQVPPDPQPSHLQNGTPFAHGTVMIRRDVFKQLGYLVSKRTMRGQDYDLWFRFFSEGHRGSNIMEPLYFVREDIDAIRRRTVKSRFYNWQTAMIGMKSINAPASWYIRPTLSLAKALIPARAMLAIRGWQAHKGRATAN